MTGSHITLGWPLTVVEVCLAPHAQLLSQSTGLVPYWRLELISELTNRLASLVSFLEGAGSLLLLS